MDHKTAIVPQVANGLRLDGVGKRGDGMVVNDNMLAVVENNQLADGAEGEIIGIENQPPVLNEKQ